MVISSLEDLLDAFAERVAERVAARDPGLIDQRDPRGLLGRRHIDAARRRMAERKGDAFQRGRDYLMTPAAVRDELERLSKPGLVSRAPEPKPRKASKASAKAAKNAELSQLKRELEREMSDASRGVER